MIEPAETQYAKTDAGYHIAYQSVGHGPPHILFVGNFFTNVEAWWIVDTFVRFIERASSFSKFVFFDQLGTGMSDPLPLDLAPGIELWADNAQTVMDAVGMPQAFLMGITGSTLPIAPFAATHPDRVSGLILCNPATSLPVLAALPDRPTGEDVDRVAGQLAELWGTKGWIDQALPDTESEPNFEKQFIRFMRMALSPGAARAMFKMMIETDVSEVIPLIKVPALIVGTKTPGRSELSRPIADQLPDAKYVQIDTANVFPVRRPEQDLWLSEIEEFVTGSRPQILDTDRVLATVLFTDICGSTQKASALGDRRWKDLLAHQEVLVRRELDRYSGRFVKDMGDGVLAVFDGPARAVRCAHALCSAVRPLGIELRAGLHTGEVELRGEDIGGIAVHIGQRVSALAGPGEVVVSSTVVDLVAGSGLEFEDRGEHELKGVPRMWKLFAVRSETTR